MIWLPGELSKAPTPAQIEAAIQEALNGSGPPVGLWDGDFENALIDLMNFVADGGIPTEQQIDEVRQAGLRSEDHQF